jgi:hypothetical protein
VDDDILTKQYLARAHMEDRKELETGLLAVGANCSLGRGGERGQPTSGPWTLL